MGCSFSKGDVANPEEVDISHFLVGACIGKGGFGKVHAVLHKGTGVQMAMKRLTKKSIVGKDYLLNTVWVERNLLELLTNSPYTNRLYFAFQSKYELFLIMPYYRGGDLNWYLLQKGKFKISAVQFYGAELALGLAELRRLKVVYRDLKPENCLFNDSGNICITDFGICGQLNESNKYKLSDRFGTTQYMSPNQYKGKPYDHCCDYYSFGLVLFEMATAKRLHASSKRNVKQETNDWYRSKLGCIQSPALHDLIMQCLEVDRTKRIGVKNIKEIFEHAFFKGVNWKSFATGTQTTKSPHIPNVKKLNCSMETLALDVISDEDPTDGRPPTNEQQKAFEEFQFNTVIKDEWTEHWNDIKARKDKEKYIQNLWDLGVDTNAFDDPKSELPADFNVVNVEIKRSMSVQFNSKKALLSPNDIKLSQKIERVNEEQS